MLIRPALKGRARLTKPAARARYLGVVELQAYSATPDSRSPLRGLDVWRLFVAITQNPLHPLHASRLGVKLSALFAPWR